MVDQTPISATQWDGSKIWLLEGGFHRLDGPAIEHADGHASWYLNDRRYTFDEFLELTPISPETKCMLKLIYG